MFEQRASSEATEMFRVLQGLDDGSPEHQRVREQIARHCLPMAERIARRYRGRGEAHDDLVQVACVGLTNAINRYDVDNGADFLSFAVPTIMGEIRRHFRDHGWAVKVPRGMKDLLPQINAARAELSQRLNRAPNASEVAEYLGVDRQLVVEATIASENYSTVSTDAPASADREYTMADTLGSVDSNLEKVLQIESVRPLIAVLPERQKTVLRLRFFGEMTQTQIAEQLGCSQMHVSRILSKALESLRNQLDVPSLAHTG